MRRHSSDGETEEETLLMKMLRWWLGSGEVVVVVVPGAGVESAGELSRGRSICDALDTISRTRCHASSGEQDKLLAPGNTFASQSQYRL